MELVPLVESDLPFVRDIYNYFTAHSMVVYFLDPIDVEEVRSFMPVGDPHYHSFIIRTKPNLPDRKHPSQPVLVIRHGSTQFQLTDNPRGCR